MCGMSNAKLNKFGGTATKNMCNNTIGPTL